MVVYKVTVYYKADVSDRVFWFHSSTVARRFHNKIEKEYDDNYRRAEFKRVQIGNKGLLRRKELVHWLNEQFEGCV